MRGRHRRPVKSFIEGLEQRLVFAAVGVPEDLGVRLSQFADIVDVNGTIFFAGRTQQFLDEIWRSDGTPQGTFRLTTDLHDPQNFTNVAGTLFFSARNMSGALGLYTTTGNSYSHCGDFQSIEELIELNGTLYFEAATANNGRELWASNGTPATTRLVKDLSPGTPSSDMGEFTVFKDQLFFYASAQNGENRAWELYKSDGTEAGTGLVKEIRPGQFGSQPGHFMVLGDRLYFSCYQANEEYELWMTDGTTAGTKVAKDLPGDSGLTLLGKLSPTIGLAVTRTYDYAQELWRVDATTNSITKIKTISDNGKGLEAYYFTPIGNGSQAVFSPSMSATGREIWKTDGTANGTVLVKDLNPGSADGVDRRDMSLEMATANGVAYFMGDNGTTGSELYRTDGTAAGTFLVADVFPGTGNGEPKQLTTSGNRMFFTAVKSNDFQTRTLWVINPPEARATVIGNVYEDYDSDRLFDATDRPLSGVSVYLDSNNNYRQDVGEYSAITSAQGTYTIANVPAGNYVVRRGYVGSFDGTSPAWHDGIPVSLTPGSTASASFSGLFRTGSTSITGAIFEDKGVDSPGVKSIDEAYLLDRLVYLDLNRDGDRDSGEPMTSTRLSGFYIFENLAAGEVVVRQIPPTGWTDTFPTGGVGRPRTVTGASVQIAEQNFAQRRGNPTPVAPVTLRASADAYVRDGSYAAQNFGSASELQLKKSGSAGSSRQFYLRFDLTSLSSIVTTVKLRLNARIDHASQTAQVAVYPIYDSGWGEGTINWNNRPQEGYAGGSPTLGTQTIAKSTPKWYEWDVTSFIAAEKAAGKTTAVLLVKTLTSTEPYLIFSSDEAATNRPELVVTSSGTTPPPPPTPQAIVVSTTAVSVPEGGTQTFSVSLAAQPTGNIAVKVDRTQGDTDLYVQSPASPASFGTLTFTPSNWSTPQLVTLAALADADQANGSATISLTSSGLTTRTVTATESDNTPTPPSGTPITLRATADAYVRDASYAAQNFGTATQLVVKRQAYAGNTRESFLRFSLTDFASASSVKLRVFAYSNDASQAVNVGLFGIPDNGWSETNVNWNNRSQVLGVSLGSAAVSGTTGKWYEFDVTDYVRQMKTSLAPTVVFVLRGMSDTDAQALIASDETATAANRPQLAVTPGTPPPPPQGLVLSTSLVNVPEGGSASFTVKLSAQPTSNVVVTLNRTAGDPDISIPVTAPNTLTFTPANWNTPQTFILAAAEDADTQNGIANFAVTAPTFTAKGISAAEQDNDAPAVPVTLRSTADAYARDGSYATTNYGNATQLQVKQSGVGWNRESFVDFDLSSVSTIKSAKLRFYGKLDNTTAPSVGFDIFWTDVEWTESNVNWNNRPTTNSNYFVGTGTVTGTGGKWYEIDVTQFLKSYLATGKYLTLVMKAKVRSDATILFDSDEGTNRPQLVVTP